MLTDHFNKPSPFVYLYLAHHGVKGQKWGVRNGPPYPLKDSQKPSSEKKAVEKAESSGIIKKTVSGHGTVPKKTTPNSIVDHVDKDGKVDSRSFYDSTGLKTKDIHTTDHGNPKRHPIVPHAHDYTWNEDQSRSTRTIRELTDDERKENDDIL